MKSVVLFLLAVCLCASGQAQNRKPKIVGQEPLSTNEDEGITILMSYLDVEDADDWFYPWGFTMTLYPGPNYSISSGSVIVPAADFSGKLTVPVTVNDGDDDSNKFKLEITVNPVNDRPVITGHVAVATSEGEPVTIALSHLIVQDPDSRYPDDFALSVAPGSDYTVSGNTVTPRPGFSGTLSVGVSVNDGQLESEVYALPVQVEAIDRVPRITGQTPLATPEEEGLAILLTHLTVVDGDNNYPDGFTLQVRPGENYTLSGATITPVPDFAGKLSVPVTVNDGSNTSQPYDVLVTVTPVNDIPTVNSLEATPLQYGPASSRVSISATVEVQDNDRDSIIFVEVGFRPEGYAIQADKLVFTAPQGSKIKGAFDPNTGVLTLLGTASTEAYTAALRSVFFETTAPSGDSRTLYIVANDGLASSDPVERRAVFGGAEASLDIPTGFTPNGDSVNDTWKIVPLKPEEAYGQARIRIYNKRGIVVYESIGLESEWDGRFNGELLPADTYFYTIDLHTNTPDGFLKGLVTILR